MNGGSQSSRHVHGVAFLLEAIATSACGELPIPFALLAEAQTPTLSWHVAHATINIECQMRLYARSRRCYRA